MHFNKNMDEEKLVYIIDGKIFDVTVNLNKGKDFGKFLPQFKKMMSFLYQKDLRMDILA